MDTLDDFLSRRPPTAERPLLGLTVLLVEDSRYTSEAFRLLCLRSGARIRRADLLANAERHLRVYRPSVVIVDIWLPDGSGLKLIEDLARAQPRVDIILGTSGDPEGETSAIAAGADGFIAKPVGRLAQFQAAILRHLPRDRQPPGPRIVREEKVSPDPISLRDDLEQVATVLSGAEDVHKIDYLTRFLGGIADSAGDRSLSEAVDALKSCRDDGRPLRPDIARLAALVQARLAPNTPFGIRSDPAGRATGTSAS